MESQQPSDCGNYQDYVSQFPDPYVGQLNIDRIKAYNDIGELFRFSTESVGTIFNAGIDWYIEQLKKTI